MHLLDPDSAKVKWALDCNNGNVISLDVYDFVSHLLDISLIVVSYLLWNLLGMRKTYWINCNVEPDIQHLSLEKERFTSNLVVRPRDLNRLLSNFQSSLHEITVIATEPSSLPSEAESEIGGKAVELRSYIDPTNGSASDISFSKLALLLFVFMHFCNAYPPKCR